MSNKGREQYVDPFLTSWPSVGLRQKVIQYSTQLHEPKCHVSSIHAKFSVDPIDSVHLIVRRVYEFMGFASENTDFMTSSLMKSQLFGY